MELQIARLADIDTAADLHGLDPGNGRRPPFVLRSLMVPLIAGVSYLTLLLVCVGLTRIDSTLASVWLPNAAAVAFLLRARLRSEVPVLVAIFLAGIAGNTMVGHSAQAALIFSTANLTSIALITGIVRHGGGPRPDMRDIGHLGWLVWGGGLVGPATSAAVAAIALAGSSPTPWDSTINWFLSESLAMMVIVPTILLIHDAIAERGEAVPQRLGERALLLMLGLLAVFLVFERNDLRLLFLIPPITMLHAFRLGSLGTALFVVLMAIMGLVMAGLGLGPLAINGASAVQQMHLIQAFIAANFLTGLPLAAVLAGREKMMRQVAADKRQLSLLADNITDAVLQFDDDGTCIYASRSALDVLGTDPGELVGQRAAEWMRADASERITRASKALLSGKSSRERFTFRRRNDDPDTGAVFVEAECAIAFHPHTREREGIVVSVRDVTPRVELELLLTNARHEAESAARAKSEFLANMSHEIRTPMNGVLGFAELLLESDLGEDQRRHAQMIVESGRSMMLLLSDILDLSKIEAGQIAITPEPVDLRGVILDCAALHRPAASQKGLELRMEFDMARAAGLPANAGDPPPAPYQGADRGPCPWVVTDGLRLRQILLNMIGNAVKFTPQGHVTVLCSVGLTQITIKVIDTGIGISAGRIDSIFPPLTQAENDTARRYGGTGLGLSISHQLASLLDGSITVESTPGAGSCFTLTLPARFAEPDAVPLPHAEPNEEVGPAQLRPSRILLVEDHDISRLLACEMLERCGQDVAIAHDGNEAIAMVIDSVMREQPFDLVLMDVQMPGCDGLVATRVIRAEGINPDDLPIVALTANAFPEDLVAVREAGMQALLTKPLAFAQLARALQRWLPTRIVDHTAADLDNAGLDRRPAHSAQVIDRWTTRRREAIAMVQDALNQGRIASGVLSAEERDRLALTLHKLAGTAGMFGEAQLGEQAATLERAIAVELSGEVIEGLARELLALAERSSGDEQPQRSTAA